MLTTSFFDSKYEGSDQVERNTAFHNQYVVNLLAGKEWKVGKQNQNAFLIDTKLTSAGGRYFSPIDLAASEAAGFEVREDRTAFSERYD